MPRLMLCLVVILATPVFAAECVDAPVDTLAEFIASVEACAAADGYVLAEPELLPRQFQRGLTPLEAYADDEYNRIDYEEFEASLSR